MNTTAQSAEISPAKEARQMHADLLEHVCKRVAPSWPLDKLIAVNPWWEWRDRPFAEVAAKMGAVAQVQCLMPKAHYRAQWLHTIQRAHLEQAARELNSQARVETLLAHVQTDDALGHWHNVSDLLDHRTQRQNRMAWQDEITQQISQFCAEYLQEGSPLRQAHLGGFYPQWLKLTRQDRGLEILMGEPGLRAQFRALPEDPLALVEQALEELALDEALFGDYLQALLLDINGWAAWLAYLRWQARLDGRNEDTLMHELLSIRLAWDLVLWRHYRAQHSADFQHLQQEWLQQCSRLPWLAQAHRDQQSLTWVWQRAAELSYQQHLHQTLLQSREVAPMPAPTLQAVFCIDVRSEPLRRALEAQNDGIQTRGFAGFFGLPIAYQEPGTELARPQLPGLLKPSIVASPKVNGNVSHTALVGRKLSARQQRLQAASPATFSFVEAAGLAYGVKLLKKTFSPRPKTQANTRAGQVDEWVLSRDGDALSTRDKTDLVAAVLGAMGLVKDFAPTVLLVGHATETCNNPHAAGLACGACGGQSGETNVRVLASLLNDPALRECLSLRGIAIPEQCRFVPALHNTTTDDIHCLTESPSAAVTTWLAAASDQARAERASQLGLDGLQHDTLQQRLRERAQDWSQLRPEWGLANNASFIVAPRAMTRSLNLQGRSFLHDYAWREDDNFAVLELIMTAPMIVTHWINMQYNASVSDNQKYGSGNKMLHNVVGGHVGVFEGNGGDLRIGLPMQSVHNGQQWMHELQRLNVYLAAPKEAIARIVAQHTMLADLIDNDWLYLFHWDADAGQIARYYRSRWQEQSASAR